MGHPGYRQKLSQMPAGSFTAGKLAFDLARTHMLMRNVLKHSFMRSVRRFLFAKMEGKRSETLPFTRWDIFLSVILAIALMAAMAYSLEPQGWTLKSALLVASTVLAVICCAQNRKVALGCAFGLVALRMATGILSGSHFIFFAVGAIAAGCAAWLCLRNLE